LLLSVVVPAPPAFAAEPEGRAWTRHTVDSSISGADGVRLGDVNGDGLADIATGWEEDGRVRAYLHPGFGAVRDPWPSVQVGLAPSVEDAVFVDLDRDGAVDVVGSTEGDERSIYVYWAPKDPDAYGDASAWKRERLPAPVQQWMFTVPANIDGKYGSDLVVGAKNAGGEVGILVAPRDARDLAGWRYVPISAVGWTMTLTLQDVDADGDQDILLADRRKTQPDRGDLRGLRWLENPGARRGALDRPWANHFIGRRGVEAMFSGSGDFDRDGDIDYVVPSIVSGAGAGRDSGELYWIENVWDGHGPPSEASGDFVEHRIPWPDNVGRAKAAAFGDVDRDGRKDVVLTFEEADGGRHGLVWLRQQGRKRNPTWAVRTLSGVDGIKHDDATLIDIDGDRDLDVFTTEERLPRAGRPTGLGLIWYENPTRHRRATAHVRGHPGRAR
jgi:hypothetical protein